jgi:alpha-L-fucosidase 2
MKGLKYNFCGYLRSGRLVVSFTAVLAICCASCGSRIGNGPELSDYPTLAWQFPLPRTHTGALLGNGTQGLMVWGGERQLNITLGRAGFWDRRGGKEFLTSTTYREVRDLLRAGDNEGLRRVFNMEEITEEGMPPRSFQIGGGRIEMLLPEGFRLSRAVLELQSGLLEIVVDDARNGHHFIRVRQSVFRNIAEVHLPAVLKGRVEVRLVPSWEHVGGQLAAWGVAPPETWGSPKEEIPMAGFTQRLPADDAFGMAWVNSGTRYMIGSALGSDPESELSHELPGSLDAGWWETDMDWWKSYWADVPRINLPDPALQEIVQYGLYKQAICTPPHGIACSLQGPFNEEYQLPPWSNDYHFNINIQMIYLPALASNRPAHLDPLWKMIRDWMPVLRQNGETFFGRPGALMLPHAVDDRGSVVGSFWTGTIDHACTAWMAQLAWLHYRHAPDEELLKSVVWPLLTGAFEGYWAMLEELPDGKGGSRLSLPVSVSPEFKGARMDAWGRDASFQLAALHMIARILPEAAVLLGEENDARWGEVSKRLPPYCTIEESAGRESPEYRSTRIALWEGMDLLESHRHHSHLAGIYPFGTFDPKEERHAEIATASYRHWIRQGAGVWSGWCVPWAAILHNRMGEPESAVAWMHYWKESFTNEGRGTLHDAAFRGMSNISSPGWHRIADPAGHREIMQLDAGFGALSAIFDLLVHEQDGIIRVLPALHRDWEKLDFDGILMPGGFLIGARVGGGQVQSVSVSSKFGGRIRLAHGLGSDYSIDGSAASGEVLEREFQPGETVLLSR